MGNASTFEDFQKARATDKIVEVPMKWMMELKRHELALEKKADKQQNWVPVSLFCLPPKVVLLISDPAIVKALNDDKTLMFKNS